jgi:tetratricopeptide (TPR) repeat protein/S1-C subfamily serine protease
MSNQILNPVMLGCTAVVALSMSTSAAQAASPIERLAQETAVAVTIQGTSVAGSGVIIHKQQDLYTLVTSRHVICGQAGAKCTKLPAGNIYSLSTIDGQKYQVNVPGVKLFENGLDLAIIQFRSSRKYPVAQLAPADSLKVNDNLYVAGFPVEKKGFTFSEGRAIAVVNKRLTSDKGGYTVVYDTFTLPGMSGGGVYNDQGKLVAIHGLGERFGANTEINNSSRLDSKIGVNRGIPIRWVLLGLAKWGINLPGGANSTVPTPTAANTADEYFITGFNQWVEPGDDIKAGKRQSIQEFTKAIKTDPSYAPAYFMRAYTYAQLQDYQRALQDIDKAIELVPNYTRSYNNRGFLKSEALKDFPGALQDFNTAIKLDPTNAIPYVNRGDVKRKMNDVSGALSDYNQAIKLNPKLPEAYNSRGLLQYSKLNNIPAAIADFDQVIAINPNLAIGYLNRGTLKDKNNDISGALADFDRAINLDPELIEAYYLRGILKTNKIKDNAGAIKDLQKARQLAQKQGRSEYVQYINRQLKELGGND